MAERGPVERATGRQGVRTRIVHRLSTPADMDPWTGPLPGPFDDGPSPRLPGPGTTQRRGTSAAQRTQTVQAARGVVPTQFGGPLTVGGFIIAAVQTTGVAGAPGPLYVDFALGEPLTSIAPPKFDGQTISQLSPPGTQPGLIAYEIHLGVIGDTTSTLMAPVIPGYYVPYLISHIVCRFLPPRDGEPAYNPFNMTTVTEGMLLPYISGAQGAPLYSYSRNPVRAATEMLLNSRFSIGTLPSELIQADWLAGADYCDEVRGAGLRWEIALRIDQRDSLENQVKFVLAHCLGHTRYDSGKIGLWMDQGKSATLDNQGNPIVFRDYGTPINLASEVTYRSPGRMEIPTVVTLNYTNGDFPEDPDDSTQYPLPADVDPNVPWIERQVSLPGLFSDALADRMATTMYKLWQRDKDITLLPWRSGAVPLPGERVSVYSKRLVPESWGVIPGDVIIVDSHVAENSVRLRAGMYRDSDYDEPPDRGGRPPPPIVPSGVDLGVVSAPVDHAPFIDPTGQAWAWLRQGVATISTIGESLLMELSSSGLNRMSAYQIDVPKATWTATAAFTFSLPQTATGTEKWWAGFFANDGASNETGYVFGSLLSSTGTSLAMTGTFAGGSFGTSGVAIPLPFSTIWLRVGWDGSAYTFEYGPDGYAWTPWSPAGVGWIPTKIGFAVGNSSAAGGKTGLRLLSWEVL